MARKNIDERLPLAGVPQTYNCVFCGTGQYEEVGISGEMKSRNMGYDEGNTGDEQMVFLECQNCGNCQRFKLKIAGEKWFPQAHSQLATRR